MNIFTFWLWVGEAAKLKTLWAVGNCGFHHHAFFKHVNEKRERRKKSLVVFLIKSNCICLWIDLHQPVSNPLSFAFSLGVWCLVSGVWCLVSVTFTFKQMAIVQVTWSYKLVGIKSKLMEGVSIRNTWEGPCMIGPNGAAERPLGFCRHLPASPQLSSSICNLFSFSHLTSLSVPIFWHLILVFAFSALTVTWFKRSLR